MTTKPQSDSLELLELLEAKEAHLRYNKWESYFPAKGPYAREYYKKHIAFMNAGGRHMQRAFIAANRTGKTVTGAYEMTCHLTGIYPDWWEGRRFLNPIDAWAAGISAETTKEIQQQELLGDINDIGTGMIPKQYIRLKKDGNLLVPKKPGSGDAVATVYVLHASGGWSRLVFKAYDQKAHAFQGTKKQVIWLDEEPKDAKIYAECITRLADKHNPGIILCTFTPLFNMSDVVTSFLTDNRFPDNGVSEEKPHKYVTRVEWDEVPHLDEGQKAEMLESYPVHQRAARSKGLPGMGSGAIYPYSEEDVFIEPIKIPFWWPRAYGMDVGWNRTAVVWGAQDPESRVIYIYSEHYEAHAEPVVHAKAIKARGEWVIGAIDPASNGKSQVDGKALIDLYENEGLHLVSADNSVEAGIYKVGQAIASGQLKILNSCKNTLSEYRTYSRDENGKIVKKKDHAMDALRYFMMTGLEYLELAPDEDDNISSPKQNRDKWTGY